MPIPRTRLAVAALVTTALGTTALVIPTYAQEAAPAPAATADTAATPIVPAVGVHRGEGHGFGALPSGRLDGLMATFDTDGNGVVTQAEIDAVRAGELADYDANGDGQLNLEEYTAYWTARVFERIVDAFQEFDANGDGNVTAEEWNANVANIVARLDQDGDAALGPTDVPQRPAPGERGGQRGGDGQRSGPFAGGPGGSEGHDRIIIIRPGR